ncbi:MAG: TetR family transcriptional regulator [Pseudomonadales bacterium]|nr:TetR family transcriptional regulator [Pseudomonadales bacterium]
MQAVDNVRKKPTQERGKQTVATILEAAIQVFDELGYEGTSTNHVADRAGVSVGTLYQYFSNKEEIMASILRTYRRQLVEDIRKGLEAGSQDTILETIESIVRSLIESHKSRANARSFIVQTMFATTRQNPNDSLIGKLIKSKFEEAALHSGRELPPQFSDIGTFVLMSSVLGVVQNAVVFQPELFDNDEFEKQLVRLVWQYLGITPEL